MVSCGRGLADLVAVVPVSAMSQITLGLRSSGGRKRLQVVASATGSALRNAIQKELGLEEDFNVRRDKNGRPGDEVRLVRTSTVRSLSLRNGDVLYITPVSGTRFKANDDEDDAAAVSMDTGGGGGGGGGGLGGSKNGSSASLASLASNKSSVASSGGKSSALSPAVAEDPVDALLSKKDGRIEQPKSANCMHKSTTQKCLYCTPLEPFDEAHLKKEGIKHMSFHSYLRKLSSGIDRGKYAALEDVSCKIKSGCTGHKPWPAGICSKCQPPAITLNRQKYRHVDSVVFENSDLVDQFLAFWRNTGSQRVGFLLGRYEVMEEVPLGIKAVVSAVYEPPQECSRDSVKLVPDDHEQAVDAVAAHLGLKKVGWIFSDLLQDSKGRVKHFRGIDSHFLSSQECIMAGNFQSAHPNPCRLSSSGSFGSKFATVLVTGNSENQVHMEGYQVSNQCMALARDGCLIPTRDAPELGYVRESSSEQYVPDVFYKEKDKYGNEVTKMARPLPVEYLLVDVPVSAPKQPLFTFKQASDSFPVENRPMEGHIQDFAALAAHRRRHSSGSLAEFFRDFHLLLYLATQTVNPLTVEQLRPLLEAVRDRKDDAAIAWGNSEHWQTIELLLEAHNGGFQ